MLSDRELRERLLAEPEAAAVHKLSPTGSPEIGGLRPPGRHERRR